MIVRMAKIRILGPKELLSTVIETLQDEGAIHIESKPPEITESGRMVEIPVVRRLRVGEVAQQTRESLEKLQEQVKKILLVLPPSLQSKVPVPAQPPLETTEAALKRLSRQLDAVVSRVDALLRKRKIHEDELSLLARYEKILHALTPLISTVQESEELEYIGLIIQAEQRHVIPLLENALERLTGGRYEIFYREVDKETLAGLLVFPKEEAAGVKARVWEENIGELRLPASIQDKPLAEAFKIILQKQAELPEKIKKLNRELEEISHRWSGPLSRIRPWLDNQIRQILASASFYETKMTFLIYGWIPQMDLPKLQERLRMTFGERVVMDRLPIDKREEDQIPVALSNPEWLRPFEIFTRILPLPRYGTIDPTPFIAVFFPLFFGAIIGDIGYGLILLMIALPVKRKYRSKPFIRDMATIFSWAAGSSMIWGIVHGELFGDFGERLGLHPLFFNRMEDFLKTLFFALAIGVVHIFLGIGLGLFIAIRRRSRHEIIGKSTGLVLVTAFLVLMAGVLGWFPKEAIFIGLAVFLLSLPLLILGGGPAATMELHNLMNILSYLRIMGIGIASAALAFAANKLGSLIENVVLGTLVAVLLHAINLGFGIFSPTIQSLRLHYVEFFENFFQGGGRKYTPFQKQT